jgi:uncharacterized surface protein with fasciclin (FAS1) repeats
LSLACPRANMSDRKKTVLFLLTLLLCQGIVNAEESSIPDNTESAEEVAEEGDHSFKTSAHFPQRPYYVLQGSQRTSDGGQRLGVWYPHQNPLSVSKNSGLKLPERVQQIGLGQVHNMIHKAGLYNQLSGERHFTMFVPTEAAMTNFFRNQPEEVVESITDKRDVAKGLLFTHVVPGTIMMADLVGGMRIKNLAGSDLEVLDTKDGLTIGGAKLLISEGKTDYKAGNGMLHMIDDVIYPFRTLGVKENKTTKKTRYLCTEAVEIMALTQLFIF